MNIQIFGRAKCFDTKKAERYFKERRIKFQLIDIQKYPPSRGELTSILTALKEWEALLDDKADTSCVRYLSRQEDRFEKLLETPKLLKTPIVRNGRQATVGYCPDVWATWE